MNLKRNCLAWLSGALLLGAVALWPPPSHAQEPAVRDAQGLENDVRRNLWLSFKERRQQNRASVPTPETDTTRAVGRPPRSKESGPPPNKTGELTSTPATDNRPPATANNSSSDDSAEAARLVGYTFWREAVASPTDETRRLRRSQIQPEKAVPMTLERIGTNTLIQASDEIRISFEVSESSYLYVIDREETKSGKLGAPYLIFGGRGDANRLEAGQLIYLPNSDGAPFTVAPDNTGIVAERLTVIFAPSRLSWLETTQPDAEGELPLSATQRAQLVKLEAQPQTVECEAAADTGQKQTQAEKTATTGEVSRRLKRKDKAPQNLCRIVTSEPTGPMALTLFLRYQP